MHTLCNFSLLEMSLLALLFVFTHHFLVSLSLHCRCFMTMEKTKVLLHIDLYRFTLLMFGKGIGLKIRLNVACLYTVGNKSEL